MMFRWCLPKFSLANSAGWPRCRRLCTARLWRRARRCCRGRLLESGRHKSQAPGLWPKSGVDTQADLPVNNTIRSLYDFSELSDPALPRYIVAGPNLDFEHQQNGSSSASGSERRALAPRSQRERARRACAAVAPDVPRDHVDSSNGVATTRETLSVTTSRINSQCDLSRRRKSWPFETTSKHPRLKAPQASARAGTCSWRNRFETGIAVLPKAKLDNHGPLLHI